MRKFLSSALARGLLWQFVSQLIADCSALPQRGTVGILVEAFERLASQHLRRPLHRGRRHARLPDAAYDRRIDALVDRYLAQAPAELVAPFAADGLVRARMWLERPSGFYRPGEYRGRRVYTERQLFTGVVEMATRRRARAAER